MARVYEAACKDCSTKFFYGETALETDSSRGLSTPERCPECRVKNRNFIRAVGAAYWEAPLETDDAKRCWGQYGLGKLVRDRDAPQVKQYKGVPINEPPPQFQIIAKVTEKLIKNLEDPNGTQVSILVGPTGTGKSTWAPYRILRSKLGDRGRICVTQPRTVTLRSQKNRGKGQNATQENSRRDTFEDEESDVILDPELEFDEVVYDVDDVDDTTTPGYIAKHLLKAPGVGAGQEVGFKFRGVATQHDHYTKLLFVTDGILINWLISGEIGQFSVVIIDEAHEQSTNMELIFALLKNKLPLYPHLKVVIASATVDINRFVAYFGDNDPKRVFVAEPEKDLSATNYTIYDRWPDGQQGYAASINLKPLTSDDMRELERIPELVKTVVKAIRETAGFTKLGMPRGDIIAFVPTVTLARLTLEAVNALNIEGLRAYVCHAQMDADAHAAFKRSDQQAAAAFDRKTTTNPQRVIIATNYAETSVTFSNLRYVIDSGFILEPVWDTESSSFQYTPVWHTQSGCTQRKGRVGRKMEGECFRLYSKAVHDTFDLHPVPQIARSPLDMFLLKAKAAGIEELEGFEWLGRPATGNAEIERAIRALSSRGALDSDGDITKRGVELQRIETSTVDLSLFMSESDAFGCSLEVATFLAMIGQPASFLAKGAEGLVGFSRIRTGCYDDLEFYLRLFHLWSSADNPKTWCKEMGIENVWMSKVEDARKRNLLQFSRKTHTEMRNRELDLDRLHRVRLVLARCMPEWICIKGKEASFQLVEPKAAGTALPIEIDRDSCCVANNSVEAFVCVERSQMKDKDRLFARHIVRIRPEWISHLKEGSPVSLALMLKKSLEDKEAIGTRERITAALPPLPDPRIFPVNTLIQITLVRSQGSSPGQDEEMWLGQELKTSTPILVKIGRSRLAPGLIVLAVVDQIDMATRQIYASQKKLIEAIKKDEAFLQAKIVALLERDNKIDAAVVELKPGITAKLRERDIPQNEQSTLLSKSAVGKIVSVVVGANDNGDIAVIHKMIFDARKRVWNVGETVTVIVTELGKNNQDGSLSGVRFETEDGVRAFLHIHKLGQMRDKRILLYPSGSRHQMLVAEIKRDGDGVSLVLDPIWPSYLIGGAYRGFVKRIVSSNRNYRTLAIIELSPGFHGSGISGALHWSRIGQASLDTLMVGQSVYVRIVGPGQGNSSYELELVSQS